MLTKFQRNTLKLSSGCLAIIYAVKKLLRLSGQSFHFRFSSKPKSQLPSESAVQYITVTISGLRRKSFVRKQLINKEIIPRSVLLITITVYLLFFLTSSRTKNKSNDTFGTQRWIYIVIMQISTSVNKDNFVCQKDQRLY